MYDIRRHLASAFSLSGGRPYLNTCRTIIFRLLNLDPVTRLGDGQSIICISTQIEFSSSHGSCLAFTHETSQQIVNHISHVSFVNLTRMYICDFGNRIFIPKYVHNYVLGFELKHVLMNDSPAFQPKNTRAFTSMIG